MPKRWRIATHDSARIESLERAAGIPHVVARLLVARGLTDPADARGFLEPKLTALRDPSLLPGAGEAAGLIRDAIAQKRRIVIYGDYDADGVTATAILLRCLRLLGADVRSYVPHRLEEGYGLNAAALESLAAAGTHTVVTVDNGVASLAEADVARRLGLQLIVTDHHQMRDRLPDAAAIVHPGLPGHGYPFTGLCGAAVAFKLAWALCQAASDAQRVSDRMRRLLVRVLGLAAIGTVADVVPLLDENRVLVRCGLGLLRQDPLPGIAALERVCRLDQNPELTGEDIGFSIAPRLNAAGRLGQAELAVELLATDDPDRAEELAGFVDELNTSRQALERSVLLAARKQAKQQIAAGDQPALVLAERDWHPGVIGIVAGKLAEQYGRPVVLVSQDKLGVKPGVGSGRSVPGFNLADAFTRCTQHLQSHGGHAAAAGLRIEDGSLDAFRAAFYAHARTQQEAMRGGTALEIDAEAPLVTLTHQAVTEIERLAPFGCGNRRPVLCTSGVRLASRPKPMGGGRHLSVEVEQHGVRLRAVAFGAGDREQELADARGPLSIAFKPVINTFRGWARVELHLEDWRADKPAAPPAPTQQPPKQQPPPQQTPGEQRDAARRTDTASQPATPEPHATGPGGEQAVGGAAHAKDLTAPTR